MEVTLLLRPLKVIGLTHVARKCITQQQQQRRDQQQEDKKMAHLSPSEIEARQKDAAEDILSGIEKYPGRQWYVLICSCNWDCGHMKHDKVPRIMLSKHLYPGELDYMFTHQPFQIKYNFKVRWHCEKCHQELNCATPTLFDE